MFSTDTTLHAIPNQSSRNPRRRHRASGAEDAGSTVQASKRRKRSSITTNTFDPPSVSKANSTAYKLNQGVSVKENGIKENGARQKTPEMEMILDKPRNGNTGGIVDGLANLVVRTRSGRSIRERRPTRSDEGVLLTKNERYHVSKEMNLPDEVQDVVRAKEPWQVRFNEELGYVVLFTHKKAVVWKYNQGSTTELRVIVIKFQNATPKPKDPLPLGVLVHDLGAGELALLVIKAGGKITYWESVSSAANADILRQKQNGLHGSLGGLLSNEQVVDAQEAESDGFILTTSAGRIIHLSVRDNQGKPAIVTELLRSSPAAAGGLFGGLKSMLNMSSWRKDIAAIKSITSRSKGSRKYLVVTKQGVLQIWNLARQSNKTMELEIDAKEFMLRSTKSGDGPVTDFQVIDFALFPTKKQQDDVQHFLFLIGIQMGQQWSYSLVETVLHGNALDSKAVYPLQSWSQPPADGKSWLASRSYLSLPGTGHTAIITFDNAILIASLVNSRDSNPHTQLQNEIDPKPDAFQDILYFAKERDFHILGCAIEPSIQSKTVSCLFWVNDCGLARITATKFKELESIELRRSNQCRTKIEQVVFFGDAPNRLFDFQKAINVLDWSIQEIQSAAMQINASVLDSTSNHIAIVAPSMEQQLKDRSFYLKALIKFVSKWNINAEIRWQLLWSAEKMAAARAVWKIYSMHLSKKDEQKIALRGRNTVLLWEALDAMSENYKHEINQEKGENDVVRQFLTRDVDRMDLLIAWSAKGTEELSNDNITNVVHQVSLASQASDVIKVGLDTAYKFREVNAALYGFAPELFEDGIYRGSYKVLPEIWTSCAESCMTVPDLARYSQKLAKTPENGESSDGDGPEIEHNDLIKLIEDAVSLARLSCQLFEERYLFQEQDNEADKQSFKEAIGEQRRELLVGLVDLMVPDEALKLAEKYRDLTALAEIVCHSKKIILARLEEDDEEERELLQTKLTAYEHMISKYFTDYGMKWAQAFYSERMAYESIAEVLKIGGQSLSEYLSRNPSLTKAKWMYDVGSKNAYKDAVHDLLKCNTDESDLWNKKVQLSLAKLSLLAAKETKQTSGDVVLKQMRHADRRLTTIQIQDSLYDYTRPQLSSSLDRDAEVGLAMGIFGTNIRDTQIQHIIFEDSISKLIARRWIGEENLIDTLTLISCPPDLLDDMAFASHRFFFALQTLRDSPQYENSPLTSLLQKIIWRRCIIQDDWSLINITEFKSDQQVATQVQETALFKTLMAGFHDGKSNPSFLP